MTVDDATVHRPRRYFCDPVPRQRPERSTVTHVVRLITETVSLPQLLLWPEALRANSRLDRTPPLGPAWFLPLYPCLPRRPVHQP
ncbi:hypothetical protein GCM10023323_22370 [Streptomyces thinghirensis]|uniref:Uncharacterized protein n=1 Tax=Streptomyces thinghirensis TaxID=551547 RepID=A0ABP9SZF5_9ACTN